MPDQKTPVIKRPAFWTFLSAGVAFSSVYFLEDVIDPVLMLDVLQALLALLGIGGLAKLGYDKYREQ